jgi:hypothetical protein
VKNALNVNKPVHQPRALNVDKFEFIEVAELELATHQVVVVQVVQFR